LGDNHQLLQVEDLSQEDSFSLKILIRLFKISKEKVLIVCYFKENVLSRQDKAMEEDRRKIAKLIWKARVSLIELTRMNLKSSQNSTHLIIIPIM
jgi:hypothetical protein